MAMNTYDGAAAANLGKDGTIPSRQIPPVCITHIAKENVYTVLLHSLVLIVV
jgi:hypothetical protein